MDDTITIVDLIFIFCMCVWTYILDNHQQSAPSEAHYYVKKENKNRFSLNYDFKNNNSNEKIYFVHVVENK